VSASLPGPSPTRQAHLRRGLEKWIRSALDAGLDPEGATALFEGVLHELEMEQTA